MLPVLTSWSVFANNMWTRRFHSNMQGISHSLSFSNIVEKKKKVGIHMNSLLEFLAFDREPNTPPSELVKLWVVLWPVLILLKCLVLEELPLLDVSCTTTFRKKELALPASLLALVPVLFFYFKEKTQCLLVSLEIYLHPHLPSPSQWPPRRRWWHTSSIWQRLLLGDGREITASKTSIPHHCCSDGSEVETFWEVSDHRPSEVNWNYFVQ